MNKASRIVVFASLLMLAGCLTQPTSFVSSSVPVSQGGVLCFGT